METTVRPEWLFELANRVQSHVLPRSSGDVDERAAYGPFVVVAAETSFEKDLESIFTAAVKAECAGLLARTITPTATMLKPTDPASNARVREATLKAAAILRKDHAKRWRLGTLARRVGCNRTELEAGFKQCFSCSYHFYLSLCRVDAAKTLLRTQYWPVTAIATAVGYRSRTSLHDNFRRITGVTPEAYRRRWRPVPVSPHVIEWLNLNHHRRVAELLTAIVPEILGLS